MEGKGAATTSHYYQPITSHYYQLLLSKVQEVVYGGVVFKRSSYYQQQLRILCRHCLGLCTAISTQALKLNCNPFCSSLQPGYNCFKQSHNFTEPFTTSNPFIWIGALVSVVVSQNIFTYSSKNLMNTFSAQIVSSIQCKVQKPGCGYVGRRPGTISPTHADHTWRGRYQGSTAKLRF